MCFSVMSTHHLHSFSQVLQLRRQRERSTPSPVCSRRGTALHLALDLKLVLSRTQHRLHSRCKQSEGRIAMDGMGASILLGCWRMLEIGRVRVKGTFLCSLWMALVFLGMAVQFTT